jgi:hypothetical protein
MLDAYKYEYPSQSNNFGKTYQYDAYPPIYPPVMYNHICRYKNTQTLFDELFSEYYHRFGQPFNVQQTSRDEYVKIDNTTENRLDIIALKYYNNPTMWWIIAAANNILDVFEVPVGTVLRIPPLQVVYDTGGILE